MTTTLPPRADAPADGPADAPARPRRGGHLHEVDLVRLMTFATVIAVHTLTFTVGDGVVPDGLQTLLHCTRGVFFALTTFVLVRGQLRDPRPPRDYLPRRFLLVGVPYLAWSFVYVAVQWVGDPAAHWNVLRLLGAFVADAALGIAEYHLYFLLVTMQVYLVLPLVVWAVRRFRGRHTALILGALAVQASIVAVSHDAPAAVAWTQGGLQQVFPTYIGFVMAGAVAAAHAGALLDWVRRRRGTVVAIVLAAAALALGTYAVQLATGMSAERAGEELQPVETVWSLAAALGLLAVGAAWADRRRTGSRGARLVAWASDRSFGVFLAHPLVLEALLVGGAFRAALPPVERVLVAYVVVFAGAVGIAELARRSPLSLPLTGRARQARVGRSASMPNSLQ